MKKMFKKMLSVLLSIAMIVPMSLPTAMTANAMSNRETECGLISAGIADWIGLTSFDDIANKIDALSVKAEENQRQPLRTINADSFNQYYNLIIEIKAKTKVRLNSINKGNIIIVASMAGLAVVGALVIIVVQRKKHSN